MLERENKLFRYGTPNKYDHHPQGTKIIVISHSPSKREEQYQQVSYDQNNPKWEKVENTAP